MALISLQDTSLTFTLRSSYRTSLKEYFVHWLHGQKQQPQTVEALKCINLEIGEGERIGLIGHNGAGKSTLLRLIAGIYEPTGGRCRVEGRVSSLFDIGLGVEHDATGWENIFFRGYMQQQKPDEIRRRAQEIADFSELGRFLDMPVRCYSSGMLVRLIFSVATAIEPELLLIDEVFSAGDLSFQDKARQRMLDLQQKAQIVVMASHDLVTLRQLCQNVIWMEHGRMRMSGPAEEVTAAYEEYMHGLAKAA